jgi:hypothetical protein
MMFVIVHPSGVALSNLPSGLALSAIWAHLSPSSSPPCYLALSFILTFRLSSLLSSLNKHFLFCSPSFLRHVDHIAQWSLAHLLVHATSRNLPSNTAMMCDHGRWQGLGPCPCWDFFFTVHICTTTLLYVLCFAFVLDYSLTSLFTLESFLSIIAPPLSPNYHMSCPGHQFSLIIVIVQISHRQSHLGIFFPNFSLSHIVYMYLLPPTGQGIKPLTQLHWEAGNTVPIFPSITLCARTTNKFYFCFAFTSPSPQVQPLQDCGLLSVVLASPLPSALCSWNHPSLGHPFCLDLAWLTAASPVVLLTSSSLTVLSCQLSLS